MSYFDGREPASARSLPILATAPDGPRAEADADVPGSTKALGLGVGAHPTEEFGDAYEVALAREWADMLEATDRDDLLATAAAPEPGDLGATHESVSPAPRWHEAAPGGDLAQLVASFARAGLEELDDFDLVELAAAAHRVSSWAHHVAARAAGELAGRQCMRPAVPGGVSTALTPTRLAGEELALRLGWSSRAGAGLVRQGTGYAGHLHATGESLRTGQIDPPKARAIVDGLEGVPIELALGVQDMVLPRAPQRTPRQIASDVRAAIVELDPPEAVERRKAAMEHRHVSKPVPLGDGMAGLWLRTGAVEATSLYEAIDRAARSARARGDSRTLDQLRADLFVERGFHEVTCSEAGAAATPSSGLGTRCSSTVRTDIRVLVPLSTLLGANEEAALLEGYGPIDPDLARSLARGGVWRRLVTDPMSGTVLDVGRSRYSPPADLAEHVRFRDLACVRPGCDASAWHSELDHISPYGPGAADGATSAANLAPLSKGCHQIKTHGGFDLERTSATTYRWTTPTGHVYDVDPPPALRALAPDDPVHEARTDLDFMTSDRSPPA